VNLEKHFVPPFTGQWIHHFIFVRIPKNASSSLYNHVGPFNLIYKHQSKFLKNLNNKQYKNFFDPTHAKPEEIKNILPVNVNDYFSFAVVRNPWDRFISMYGFMHKLKLWELYGYKNPFSFEEFCDFVLERFKENDQHFFPTQNQVEWLDGAFKVKKILFFENIQQDFEDMLKEKNMNHINPKLPHLNSCDHKNYREYYTDKTKSLVEEIFKKDLDTFDYKF
jgi:hypothetical protein